MRRLMRGFSLACCSPTRPVYPAPLGQGLGSLCSPSRELTAIPLGDISKAVRNLLPCPGLSLYLG